MHCRALLRVLFLARRRRGDGQLLGMVVAALGNLPLLPQRRILLLNGIGKLGLGALESDIEFIIRVRNWRERRGDGVEEPPAGGRRPVSVASMASRARSP